MISTLSSGSVLCNEILHKDFEHRARLLSLIDRTSVDDGLFLTFAIAARYFEDEIGKRIDRLGGMAGEW